MLTIEEIKNWLSKKNGVLIGKSAIVHRESYFGNNIIAENDCPKDSRGYAPVELWIMSMVQAENPISIKGEGITKILIHGVETSLTDLDKIAGNLIFSEYREKWPLTKILDIGGKKVETSFGTKETPPIPVHTHGGSIKNGIVQKPGKSEAYFFPPTDIPPYNKNISVKTRIGLKAGVTKDDVKKKLSHFGKDDSMFELLNEFDIKPNSGWTVPEGVLHAPGPYLTFEIQLPQDDYNNGSWRLGERLVGKELKRQYEEHVLRGLKDENEIIEKILDWEITSDQNLEKKYFHQPKLINSGLWGKRHQIFFDQFYGEGWEILPNQTLNLPAKEKPQAGIVWSGIGEINGNHISQGDQNEFLCIPQTEIKVKNTGTIPLLIYTVEPIK